jgi:hypothetical protein
MIHQIEKIWRQTRDLPPAQLTVINSLFSEIEHLHQEHQNQGVMAAAATSIPARQLELFHQPKYYEPKWFSTNGKVQ